MQPARRRIVARPAQPQVEPEPRALAHDIGLGHVLERGVDAETLALDPGLGRERGHVLERGDEFGAAIGIARIIERIDPDYQVARARGFRPAQRQAEEDRVARGHIGDGDVVADAVLRHVDIGGQRRTAERAQIERQHDVPLGAERVRDPPRGGELDLVALVIVDRQREQPIAVRAHRRRGNHRVEAARNQGDRQGRFSLHDRFGS